MQKPYKRYCKTLNLRDDSALIAEYKRLHAPGAVWPEIIRGMKEVGIINMEIYLDGAKLFMIMDTEPDFDHDAAMTRLGKLPRQAEWEAHVSKLQKTTSDASANEKWRLAERIFTMEGES